jgi:hypothetical protein
VQSPLGSSVTGSAGGRPVNNPRGGRPSPSGWPSMRKISLSSGLLGRFNCGVNRGASRMNLDCSSTGMTTAQMGDSQSGHRPLARRADDQNRGAGQCVGQATVQEATIDELVQRQMERATADLMTALAKSGPRLFSSVLVSLLQPYMLRETNVKDICVDLAKAGKIENTWGTGNQKPRDKCLIKLTTAGTRSDRKPRASGP